MDLDERAADMCLGVLGEKTQRRIISEQSQNWVKPVKHFSTAQPITQLSANIISGPEVIQASAIPEPFMFSPLHTQMLD